MVSLTYFTLCKNICCCFDCRAVSQQAERNRSHRGHRHCHIRSWMHVWITFNFEMLCALLSPTLVQPWISLSSSFSEVMTGMTHTACSLLSCQSAHTSNFKRAKQRNQLYSSNNKQAIHLFLWKWLVWLYQLPPKHYNGWCHFIKTSIQ